MKEYVFIFFCTFGFIFLLLGWAIHSSLMLVGAILWVISAFIAGRIASINKEKFEDDKEWSPNQVFVWELFGKCIITAYATFFFWSFFVGNFTGIVPEYYGEVNIDDREMPARLICEE